MSSSAQILPAGAGYGVVIGVGFFFAFNVKLMMGISHLQNKYTSFSTKTSEEFNTASRSIKPGLIASGIVSAWTWAATLLQSSTVAYQYGVAGPFWYAAGATVQILMFSILACKVKMNAPRAHTYLEIVQARYGSAAHITFLFFAFVTNILVGSQLLLGGSAVVTSLTGMNVYAAIFLIPVGVCAYVVLGGLRATFLCDYSHTLILMIIILYFMFNAYATSDLIGSPGEMYELLKKAAVQRPVEGNVDGSYMTLKSNYALIFGVIQLCSGSGTVFLDQAYWQRAIASRPATAVRAYILGGIAWFAIPFGFSTTLGLAAVALTDNPRFPTFPGVPTSSDISAGLAASYAAQALLGKGGAVALLIVLFMAVTSCASAELIAVSSLLTFDVYKRYIRPTASPSSLIFVSHAMICAFGLTMAVFACIWNAIGVDLGWLFLVMGLLIGGAVFPAAFAITWRGQSAAGAISGAIVGLIVGIAAWLAVAKVYFGEVTVATTGTEYATLAGNLAAIMTGLIVTVTVSLIKPQNFDWAITRSINAESADPIVESQLQKKQMHQEDKLNTSTAVNPSDEEKTQTQTPENEKNTSTSNSFSEPPPPPNLSTETDTERAADLQLEESPSSLRGAFKLACIASFLLTFIMDFLLPMPMFFSHYVFSKGFFTAWVVISFLWVFVSTGISVVLPVVETAGFLKKFAGDVFGGKKGRV
ncbi:solute symporter family transporter [Aureobasidium pullulans]|uniref:Solute symporter family transporter n=1 Tax=Aureobasidium pullulans TaxID=5580 RepID=A0A4V4ICT5_AURPU|nr:solute symporter family transporter [Aureobasidium pullulans]